MAKTEIERDEKGKFLAGNKSAVKHGCYSFKVDGKVPSVRGARKLKQELNRIREELEASVTKLSIKEELLINQVISAVGFCSLFEAFCVKAGILNPRKWRNKTVEFQPGFQTYLSMMNSQRSALMALGLDEKAEEVLTTLEYIKQYDEKKRTEESGEKGTTQTINQAKKSVQKGSQSDILQR